MIFLIENYIHIIYIILFYFHPIFDIVSNINNIIREIFLLILFCDHLRILFIGLFALPHFGLNNQLLLKIFNFIVSVVIIIVTIIISLLIRGAWMEILVLLRRFFGHSF
jgi:hypothetical protein